MLSIKLIYMFIIIGGNLAVINGQFGFGSTPFFGNAGGAQGGFTNQNTNFQQHRGGAFGVLAGFGAGGSSTNFNQQNSGAGFSNFGNSFGRFRNSLSGAEENDGNSINSHAFRYASPYDEPTYEPPKPTYVAPRPTPYKPASYEPSPSVQCPQNLLIGCSPQVQYVPCQSPPVAYPSYS